MMAKGEYCNPSTASEMFLIFTTQLYQFAFFLLALISDEPEIFLPKYSQTAILHAADFRRVVNNIYEAAIFSPLLGEIMSLSSSR